MTEHPCKGMTAHQIEVFEQIATGVSLPPAKKGTIQKLRERGLVVAIEDKPLHDELGEYSIPQYEVPISVHKQWCQWCSEQPENAS